MNTLTMQLIKPFSILINIVMTRISCFVFLFPISSLSVFAQLYAPEIKVHDTNNMIGIGRTPVQALDVDGSIRMNINEATDWESFDWGNSQNEKPGLSPWYIDMPDGERIFYKAGQTAFGLMSNGADEALLWDQDGRSGPYKPVFLKNYGIGFYKIERRNQNVSGATGTYISGHYGIDFFVRKELAMRIDHEAGTVGIGTSDPEWASNTKLDVGGQIRMYGALIHSDEQLKQNIQAYSQGLDLIKKLNVFKYELKKEVKEVQERNEKNEVKEKISQHVGIIAQELQQLAPNLIHKHKHKGEDGEETLAYDFTSFTFLLMNSIKEQQSLIEQLQQDVNLLKISKGK